MLRLLRIAYDSWKERSETFWPRWLRFTLPNYWVFGCLQLVVLPEVLKIWAENIEKLPTIRLKLDTMLMTKVWCTVSWALISIQISLGTAICVCIACRECIVCKTVTCHFVHIGVSVLSPEETQIACQKSSWQAMRTLWLRLNASFMLDLMDFPLACTVHTHR